MFSIKSLYTDVAAPPAEATALRDVAMGVTDRRLLALITLLAFTRTLLRNTGISPDRIDHMPVIADAEDAIAGWKVLTDDPAPYTY